MCVCVVLSFYKVLVECDTFYNNHTKWERRAYNRYFTNILVTVNADIYTLLALRLPYVNEVSVCVNQSSVSS